MEENLWNKYQNKTDENNHIPEYLKIALNRFENFKGTIVDIGCGNGNECLYMIKKGWKVIAIDQNTEIIENKKMNMKILDEKLIIKKERFEESNIPKNDMVYANFSIPFCKSIYFNDFIEKIIKSININGRFAGVLFGIHDDWNKKENVTCNTKEELLKIFKNFKIEYFLEKECDGQTALGKEKHWHIFIIVAKKEKERWI